MSLGTPDEASDLEYFDALFLKSNRCGGTYSELARLALAGR